MTAATETRLPVRREGRYIPVDVAASTKLFKGTMVAHDSSGNAVKASADATLVVLGMAREEADNSSGSAGDIVVEVEFGVFRFENSSGGDAIAADDIGAVCYAADDQTVALTSNSGARPVAGVIFDVDSDGVWVQFGPDIHAADTRGGQFTLAMDVLDLSGTGTDYVVAPVACKVVSIYSVIDGALATGNATLTGKINATAITDGAITVTQAGSADGDVDSATPSALNIAAAGDKLAITVGGTNSNAVNARVTFLCERI